MLQPIPLLILNLVASTYYCHFFLPGHNCHHFLFKGHTTIIIEKEQPVLDWPLIYFELVTVMGTNYGKANKYGIDGVRSYLVGTRTGPLLQPISLNLVIASGPGWFFLVFLDLDIFTRHIVCSLFNENYMLHKCECN